MEERLDSGQTPPARPLGLTAALFVITLGAYVVVWVHRVYGELRRAGRTALPPLLAAGPLVVPALNALWLLYLGIDLPRALRRLFAQAPRGEQPETEMLSALLILPVFGGLGIALLAGLPVWLAGYLAWPLELPAVLLAQHALNRVAGTPRPPAPVLTRDRETIASVVVAVVLLGAAAVALVAGSDDGGEQPVPRSAGAKLGTASDIAYAAGSFWVTDARKGTLQRVDFATRRAAGAAVKLGDEAIDVGAGGGSLWVALYKDGRVARVDPRTGRVVESVQSGRGPFGIATGGGSVWATNQIERTVVEIDARKGTLAHKPFQVEQGPRGVAVGEGATWVANFEGESVSRVDPGTGKVRNLRVGRACHDVAAAYGSVWVSNPGEGFVTRIDPDSGKPAGAPITAGAGAAIVEAGLGRVWVASGSAGTVTRIDPGTGGVSNPIRLRGQIADLTVARGAVWALLADGRVARVSR